MSPNKTLQGIYSQLVWDEQEKVSRRAMHEAVFEAGWNHQELMAEHRKVLSPVHRGKGREIIALDWTFSYHPYSEKIFGAKSAYDYVNRGWSCYQTVVTASISNGKRVDGIAVEVQHPNYEKEELAYLEMTAKQQYEQMEQVTEIERSRNVMWDGQWQRVEQVETILKNNHPESFRHKLVRF